MSDDHWPETTLASYWTQVSGPETVGFDNNAPAQTTVMISQTGTYVLRLTATDGVHTNSDDVALDVITCPFDTWRGTHFSSAELEDILVSGPLGDPDLDGGNNLEEYFFGTLPKQANLPRYHGRVENNHFDIIWVQRLDCPDVVIEVERADRVEGPWFGGPGLFEHVEVVEPGSNTSHVVCRSLLPATIARQQFIRLTMTLRDE